MKKNINIQLFLLCISLFLIQFAIFTKNIVFITNYAQNLINIAIGILFISSIYVLLTIKITFRQWTAYFIMLILTIISFIKTNDSIILQLFLTTISSIKIDFKKLIKYDITFKIILLVFIVLCYYNGYSLTRVFTRDNELRYAYGFNHPNTFGYFILILFFEIMYIKNTNLKLYKSYILFFLTYYFINSAGSRSSQISIILFMLIYTIYYIRIMKNEPKNKKQEKKINIYRLLKLSFPILTIISIIITNEYVKGSPFAIKIDEIFSKRLLLQSKFLSEYNFNLIGNNIFYFHTLDNVYIKTLLNYGLLIFILYTFIYNKMISKAIRENDKIILIIIFIFLIYGMMEWYIIRPAINIFLIYFSSKKSNKILK